jgi:type I restriction enzyme, S subunit
MTGWTQTSLGELCDITMGQSPSSDTYNTEKNGLPFFQGKAEFSKLYPVTQKWCSKPQKKADEGDILISVRAPVGDVNIANQYCCIGRGLAAIKYDICPRFIFYFLKHSKGELEKLSTGTTFKAISKQTILNYSLFIPSLKEQHQIVAKIQELFSKLDNGIENLKKAREQLKTYRQAVLKYAFEGKLTEGWRKENIGLEALAKRVTDEGKLPDGWKHFTIGEVAKTIDGDRGRNYPKKDEFFKQGYCLFLSTKNVREDRFIFEENIFITKEKDDILRGGKLQLNDVVITTRGTLGNVALYDENVLFKNIRINSGMLILRVVKPILNQLYLMRFISSPWFSKQLNEKRSGSAQPQIPANVLREIKIPIPLSIAEQKAIVSEIESRLSICDKLEQTIEDSLKKAETLRQSIMKKAFNGELTKEWREQHPELVSGENSAEKLLEGIKAEKEKTQSKKAKKNERHSKHCFKGLEFLPHATGRRRQLRRLPGATHLPAFPQDGR